MFKKKTIFQIGYKALEPNKFSFNDPKDWPISQSYFLQWGSNLSGHSVALLKCGPRKGQRSKPVPLPYPFHNPNPLTSKKLKKYETRKVRTYELFFYVFITRKDKYKFFINLIVY